MQVAFFLLAEKITQVKEAIPWVRCASGNVYRSTIEIDGFLMVFPNSDAMINMILILLPSLSMVFDGFGPLVKQCNGFDGSLWSRLGSIRGWWLVHRTVSGTVRRWTENHPCEIHPYFLPPPPPPRAIGPMWAKRWERPKSEQGPP